MEQLVAGVGWHVIFSAGLGVLGHPHCHRRSEVEKVEVAADHRAELPVIDASIDLGKRMTSFTERAAGRPEKLTGVRILGYFAAIGIDHQRIHG